jgi:hypothetical protein
MSGPSPLTTFGNMLVRFFEELRDTFPEEKEIKAALETIQNAKKINPRLILDLFYENISIPLREAIANENFEEVVTYARQKINVQFNEILPAIAIFDRHWGTLADANRQAIWKYLKVLVVLGDKAKNVRV